MAVIYFIMIFLSLIGIIEIVSYLIYHLMSVKAKWMGTLRPQKIVIVTDGVNDETLKGIKAMTCGYDYIEILEKKDREKILNLL